MHGKRISLIGASTYAFFCFVIFSAEQLFVHCSNTGMFANKFPYFQFIIVRVCSACWSAETTLNAQILGLYRKKRAHIFYTTVVSAYQATAGRFTHTHTHKHIPTHTHTSTYTHTRTHTHTQAHTHTHRHTHTHTIYNVL